MTRIEKLFIGIFLAFMVPLAVSMFGGGIAAMVLLFRLYPATPLAVTTGALAGLGVGVMLTIIYLGAWVRRFYINDTRLMLLIFLYGSFVMTVLFRGMPLGNLLLGTVAGIYTGRRLSINHAEEQETKAAVSATARLASLITGVLILLVGLTSPRAAPQSNVLAVVVAAAALSLVQYFITSKTALVVFAQGSAGEKKTDE